MKDGTNRKAIPLALVALSAVFGTACGNGEPSRPQSAGSLASAGGAAGAAAGGTAGQGAPTSGAAGAPSAAGGPQGGAAGTQAAAGSAGTTKGGAAGAPPPTDTTCPTGLPGPALVQLPALGGGSYCMDRTEVTQAQYSVFMDAAAKDPAIAKVPDGPVACPADARLILRTPGPADGDAGVFCPASFFDLEAHGDAAVVCVGHCAARAYCAWAGKELCGSPQGGPSPREAFADPAQSAWMNACTNGGKTEAPDASGACATVTVALKTSVEAFPTCRGAIPPFDQVLNLGGGVDEWENACEVDGCMVGLAAPGTSTEAARACSFGGIAWGERPSIGFRCCKPLAGGS